MLQEIVTSLLAVAIGTTDLVLTTPKNTHPWCWKQTWIFWPDEAAKHSISFSCSVTLQLHLWQWWVHYSLCFRVKHCSKPQIFVQKYSKDTTYMYKMMNKASRILIHMVQPRNEMWFWIFTHSFNWKVLEQTDKTCIVPYMCHSVQEKGSNFEAV